MNDAHRAGTKILHTLRQLHDSMGTQGVERAHFNFAYNGLHISAAFFADESPYTLAICRATVGVALFEVGTDDYDVSRFFGENYGVMLDILGIARQGTGENWKPVEFLEHFDRTCIPSVYQPRAHECRPEQAAQRHHDLGEEPDKVFFLGMKDWTTIDGYRDNPERLARVPSAKNLTKTSALLGEKTAAFCKKHHISTLWTANPSDAAVSRTLSAINHRLGLE